jgi:hypothetical protein
MSARFPLALLAAILLTGCMFHHPRYEWSGPLPIEASALPARLQAAKQVSNQAERDDALQKVARDAAATKQAALAKDALHQITNTTVQERAAAACALALSRSGDPTSAIEVAQMISSQSLRDDVLVRIAKGP